MRNTNKKLTPPHTHPFFPGSVSLLRSWLLSLSSSTGDGERGLQSVSNSPSLPFLPPHNFPLHHHGPGAWSAASFSCSPPPQCWQGCSSHFFPHSSHFQHFPPFLHLFPWATTSGGEGLACTQLQDHWNQPCPPCGSPSLSSQRPPQPQLPVQTLKISPHEHDTCRRKTCPNPT